MSNSDFGRNIITYIFYLLAFLVPIVWLPVTNELFEFNKMVLVYLGVSVVLTVWSLQSLEEGKVRLKRTPLDIPILLFLLANILATIFSIDWHTSVFGYYTRLNGGLVSTLSYIILFYAFVTFIDRKRLFKFLKILLFSSILVSIYAILQHPNPLFRDAEGSFRGIDSDYWRQNSEARVFSTLGHPNWLAAFLVMVIPFAFFFLATTKRVWEKLGYYLALVAYFLAFTFTYSRGGTLGMLAVIFVLTAGILFFVWKKKPIKYISLTRLRPPKTGFFIGLVLASWLLIFAFFGNAFTSRGIDLSSITAQDETQLASYGAETGRIRLIVWRGAWDIFKSFPLLGSGVETFAYSYYLFRPAEHNLTGEWDFLYNKAHNEFVNYLATTGILGFATYIFLISTFLVLAIKLLRQEKNKVSTFFYLTALSSYTGYHVQNFFGFSVVILALLFFLIPGFVIVYSESLKEIKIDLTFVKKVWAQNLAKMAVFLGGILLVIGALIMWVADYYYTTGISTSSLTKSYNDLKFATILRPDNPLYKSALALTAVSMGALESESKSSEKLEEGFNLFNQVTSDHPNNISLLQTRMEAIYGLSIIDSRYTPQALVTAEKLASLAPTSAKQQYNLAVIYVQSKDYEEAQKQLETVVDLKFNYIEAWRLLLKVDKILKDSESYNSHDQQYKLILKELDEN